MSILAAARSTRAGCMDKRCVTAIFGVVAMSISTLAVSPVAHADNKRLNDGLAVNVYTIHRQQNCGQDVTVSPPLQLAAQWHTDDVLNDRELDADVGSDGSTVQARTNAAGYRGNVAETVVVNPALAISGIELLNQLYGNPAYLGIIRDCRYSQIGVWSENSLDRTVVVAVYGQPL